MFTISVILPTYNGATRGEGKYLKQAIESVLNQSYSNFELIIINDGSIDDTEKIIKTYKDERIIYLKHDINKGPAAARNTGLRNSRGEYIAFLDDDDYFYKNKLEIQMLYMLKKLIDISLCDGDVITENGVKIRQIDNKGVEPYIKDIYCFNINGFASIMIDKKIINYGLYFNEYLTALEDWDFLLRAALKYNFSLVSDRLYAYRKHPQSLSLNIESMYINSLFISFNLLRELLSYYNGDEKKYYFDNFFTWVKSTYYNNYYKVFRNMFKISKLYGSLPFIWHIKYYLSYFPFIVPFLKKIRSLCKKKHA